jgi:hypothetical protein
LASDGLAVAPAGVTAQVVELERGAIDGLARQVNAVALEGAFAEADERREAGDASARTALDLRPGQLAGGGTCRECHHRDAVTEG